jgi:ATPase subunit of ABC transporter with duplicated ATPase domains
LDAIDALITGLAAYKGGVLLVSHDQHFISAVADELWCAPLRARLAARCAAWVDVRCE